MASARKAAVSALLKVNRYGGYSNLVLDATLKENRLTPADAALASALFYGVLERKITLDYFIAKYAKGGLSRISPYVRECLRIGLYQMKYMDKIPVSAAVNESVGLVKNSRENRAAGFVNAVLRAAGRDENPDALPSGGTPADFSVRYSCALPVVESLFSDYGAEVTAQFLEDSLQVPPVYIRVNPLKTDRDSLREKLREAGISAEDCPFPDALRLTQPGGIEGNPLYRSGLFHVQDYASQICCRAVDPRPGERVLDLCAAPGGKTFTMAEMMEDSGQVVASDLYPARAELISSGAGRLGLSIVLTRTGDASVFQPGLGEFDRVLCDVPCSGWGIIRRKPDIKYKPEEEWKNLPEIQNRILEQAAGYVKQGGRLVYSTCTLRRKENELVCGEFLASHPDFQPEEVVIPGFDPAAGGAPWMTLMPHTHGSDGFFIAVFRKLGKD